MKKMMLLMLTLLIGSTASMKAQVRIGGGEDPHPSAVLDLNADNANTGNFGLSLPRVNLTSERQQLNGADPVSGTIVYNTNVDFARGKGIYFFADSLWLRAGTTFSMREGDTIVHLQKPVIKILDNPAKGLGASFGLNSYADLGSAFRIDWQVTPSPAGYTPVLDYSESPGKRDIVFVPYDGTDRTYTLTAQAIADGYNDSPVSDAVVSGAGIFEAAYDLVGESYYDIAQTEYYPGQPEYGILAYRTPYALDPAETYTYAIKGTGNSPTYSWSVDGGSDYLANATDIFKTTTASVNVKFKDLSGDATILGTPAANLTVTLACTVEDGTYNKTFTKVIKIADKDACSWGVTDTEGHSYLSYRFGGAGCWMTQNLRSTKTVQDGIEKVVAENSNPDNVNTPAYYYVNGETGKNNGLGVTTNPEYGLLYSWAGANVGTSAIEPSDEFKSGANSTRQGLCPSGWVLPSDYDFYTGNTDQTFWGRQMKSPTAVTSMQATQTVPALTPS